MAPERVKAYRRAAARAPVRAQISQIMTDVANLSVLSSRQDLEGARGMALALAHGALALAVTPASGEDDRRHRGKVLRGTVLPVLASAGLGHVEVLVEVALAHEGDPARKAKGVETKQ